MLVKRPTAAAPNAWTTIWASSTASSPSVGAIRIPDMAANDAPDRPRGPPHRGAGQADEISVVDHTSHGDPEAGPDEE